MSAAPGNASFFLGVFETHHRAAEFPSSPMIKSRELRLFLCHEFRKRKVVNGIIQYSQIYNEGEPNSFIVTHTRRHQQHSMSLSVDAQLLPQNYDALASLSLAARALHLWQGPLSFTVFIVSHPLYGHAQGSVRRGSLRQQQPYRM